MQSNSVLVARDERRGDDARSSRIARRLNRFHSRYRESVRQLAERDGRIADLAVSFPALLFTLASPRTGAESEGVLSAVLSGRSLKAAAARAGLPLWTRALAPEAFEAQIPILPSEDAFNREIANYLPRSPKLAPAWLKAIGNASDWGDEYIAAWVAREISRDAKTFPWARLRLVCLWAWCSNRGGAVSQSLAARAWSRELRFTRALDLAEEWLGNVSVLTHVGTAPIGDPWLAPCQIDGLDFVPLRSAREIIDEATLMKNCLRHYANRHAIGKSSLWSLRKGGDRVATLELGASSYSGDPFVGVRQLRGPRNRIPEEAVARAVQSWLRRSELKLAPKAKPRPICRATWISLWRPYWLAKRRIPDWLPLSPSHATLYDLARQK